MLIFTVIGLVFAATQNIYFFFAALPFVGTSQAVYRVVTANSALLKTDPKMKGEVMGIIASIMTASMVIIPITAGTLFEQNISYPFLMGAIFAFAAFALSYKNST